MKSLILNIQLKVTIPSASRMISRHEKLFALQNHATDISRFMAQVRLMIFNHNLLMSFYPSRR